ncbi:hypothetical protein Tsubulata_003860, partial [Turnera subulata]
IGSASPCDVYYNFSSLKTFVICYCPSIKQLFPHAVVGCLHNLNDMVIHGCVGMEEVIAVSEEDICADDLILPKLRVLDLQHLPELRSIWFKQVVCPSLQEVTLRDCLKLKRVPISLVLPDDAEPSRPSSLPRVRYHRLVRIAGLVTAFEL